MKYKKSIYVAGVIFALVVGFAATAQGGKFVRVWPDTVNVYKLMSSPQEFEAQGGDWNNIETIGDQSFGSVVQGNDYYGTTTFPTNGTFGVLRGSSGTLAQVTITGVAAGIFSLYDATTTNVTLRNSVATTSLVKIATFQTSVAAGTYTFDRVFRYGLLFVQDQGTQGTTTITWR